MVAHGQRLFVRRGGGGRFTDRHCRGRRPRRPAEVSGDAKVHGRDESLPYEYTVDGSFPGGGGAVKTAPYDAKDKRAVAARLRAGHARPLRTATNGLRTGGAREGGSPPLRSGRVVARERAATQGPSKPLRPACAASSPLRGAPFARAKPAREASPSGEVAAKQAGGVRGLAGGCPLMGYYGRLRAAYMPPLQSTR